MCSYAVGSYLPNFFIFSSLCFNPTNQGAGTQIKSPYTYGKPTCTNGKKAPQVPKMPAQARISGIPRHWAPRWELPPLTSEAKGYSPYLASLKRKSAKEWVIVNPLFSRMIVNLPIPHLELSPIGFKYGLVISFLFQTTEILFFKGGPFFLTNMGISGATQFMDLLPASCVWSLTIDFPNLHLCGFSVRHPEANITLGVATTMI